MTRRLYFTQFAYVVLTVLGLGIVHDPRVFVKFHIGPLYVLEIGLCLIFLASIAAMGFREFIRVVLSSKLYLAFAALGLSRLLFQVGNGKIPNVEVGLTRAAQFTLLTVYPVLWVTVGKLFSKFDQEAAQPRRRKVLNFSIFLALILFWSSFPNFTARNVGHLTLGSSLALLLLWLVTAQNIFVKNRLNYWAASFGVGFFAFLPFWKMWMSSLQRTSVGILIFFILTAPWVIQRLQISKLVRSVKISAGVFIFFLLGLPIASQLKDFSLESLFSRESKIQNVQSTPVPVESSASAPTTGDAAPVEKTPTLLNSLVDVAKNTPDKLKRDLVASTKKEDDGHTQDNSPSTWIEARARRHMWKTAIENWMRSPIFGVGFAIEVLTWVLPWHENKGVFEKNSNPVNGAHNSYLTLLARTGVVGMIVFLALLIQYFLKCLALIRSVQGLSITEYFAFYSSMACILYSLLNVGLESPHHAFTFWLFVGYLLGQKRPQERGPSSLV